jgi:hypothetical protein
MNWAIKRLRPYRYWLLLAVLTAVFFGCLTKQEPDTFTLPEKFVDSLSQYDSVQIVLKDTSGKTLDVLFHGKVVFADQLRNLPAPHALEGEMLVTIIGYQNGKVTYRVDRLYNGRTHQVETHQPIILPTSKVSFDVAELRIPKKTTLPLPIVTVEPADLADKTLIWTSSNTKVFEIGAKGLLGIAPGTAFLHVALKSDTAKHADIPITVVANPKLPDSLRISPDTLKLAAKGRAGQFIVQAFPATAGAVSWHLEGETVASIIGNGQVQGLKRGAAVVRVVSKEDEMISDSAVVAVSDPIPVESVRFPKTKLDLFVEGAAESLLVEVRPLEANPEAVFSVRDSSIARILNGRVLGLREGVTDVIAMSSENPAKTDSLRVTVYPTQKVDSLRLTPDTLRLYVGGEAKTLQAELFPSTLAPLIQWNSASPSIAAVDSAGRINPVSEGKTFVTAISKADSGKKDASLILVKRDVPILDVGRDTTISVGQTVTFTPKVSQEYGTVIRFKWDLNGDGAWDDSASGLKSVTYKYDLEKELAVAFYVRDTEGNDTTVLKKIRVVDGPVVLILSPLDSTYTRLFFIDVSWSVNGKEQDSLKKQGLKIGENTITRSAKDEAGKIYSASVTVIVDTTAPSKPVVRGPLVTNSQTPTWSWTSGGGGGSGVYRCWIDVDDSSKGKEVKDTVYIPPTEISEGIHTLFVSERDRAGNWSQSHRHSIRIDLTPPSSPNVSLIQSSPSNNPKAGWKWTSGGGGKGWYRFKLEDEIWNTGIQGEESTFIPKTDLTEGTHILFVQEQDSAGNWSKSASATIVIDITPPNPPMLDSLPYSPLNTLKPRLTWKSGGGAKVFRARIDTSDLKTAPEKTDSVYTLASNLTEGGHTLYVQERDVAGNWSAIASRKIVLVVRGIVGTGAISDFGPSSRCGLDIDRNGDVFVSYSEQIAKTDEGESIQQSGVKKLNGIIWEKLGNSAEFGLGIFSGYGISVDANGIPYVGIFDSLNRASVLRYSEGHWQPVGSRRFTPENSVEFSLQLSPTNVPYVFFSDGSSSGRGSVLRFNGLAWEAVGPKGFSLPNIDFTRIVFSSSGIPYIAFVDADGFKILRFSGSNWEPVGNLNVHSVGGFPVNIFMSKSDSLFVAMTTTESGGKGQVFKFNGSTWKNVGDAAFEAGAATLFNVASSSHGGTYIAYVDKSNSDRLTLKGLKDDKWIAMGPATFSTWAGGTSRLVLNPLGVPHIAGPDESNESKTVLQNGAFDP